MENLVKMFSMGKENLFSQMENSMKDNLIMEVSYKVSKILPYIMEIIMKVN